MTQPPMNAYNGTKDTIIVLGFDYGSQKIGIAYGQCKTGMASPLKTLPMIQQRPDWDAIAEMLTEWRPDALVVGLPLNMDDSPTLLTERVRRFARQLEGRYRLPVHLVDERLSTREARQRYGGSTHKRGIDAFAAMIITETWLSEHHR